MKVALIQMRVTDVEAENLTIAARAVRKAAADGADFAVLPEMFCCPYDTNCFADYAQPDSGPRRQFLRALAQETGLYLIAGSVPECAAGKLYNTAYVFARDGALLAKHRKIHLFDIDIPGGQSFRESAVLSPGNQATVFSTEFGVMGLMICFDIRFPALAALLARQGVTAIFVPAAFNPTTGPAHWELLFRARAVDNQCFTVGVAAARNAEANYQSYGHSLAVSPWGEVLTQLDWEEGMQIVTLDPAAPAAVARQIPLAQSRKAARY